MRRFVLLFLLFLPGLLYSQDKVFLDSLLVQLDHSKRDSSKVKVLWALFEYHSKSDLSKSMDYGLQSLELAKKTRDPLLVATSHTYLLNIFFQLGNFNSALKNGLEALKIYEELGKEKHLFKVYQNLGVVFDQMKEYDKALDYYFKGLSIYNKATTENKKVLRRKMPIVYNCIGAIYNVKKEPKTALQYYTKALEISKEIGNDAYLGMIYNNLGKLFMNLDNEDQALNYFHLSLKHRKKINDLNGMARTYLFEGIYYKEIEKYDKALEIAEKAKSLIELIGRQGLMSDLELLFFEIYQGKQQYQKALESHVRYKQLSDSLRSEANLKEQISLQLQYQYEKKEKIREAEQEKIKFQYGLIISILTLGFIITGLLYSLTKSRNKRISLEKKNLEKDIELKNRELTTNVMYLLKKNELMNSITTRLVDLKSRLKGVNSKTIREIILELENSIDKDVWEEFEVRFHQVHEDFFKKLLSICPNLSPGELKICAFLKLNMSSKEIASIIHQNSKSIEVKRTRIRKKLNLTNRDVNLIAFLNEL